MLLFDLPSLRFLPRRYRYSGVGDWSGHIAFVRDLVAAMRPATFVELGTHYGDSYFAVCQSIQDEAHPARAFAVDTWRGDAQTGHYGDEVFEDVAAHNREFYSGFSTLLRMPFDEAVERFDDGSIDLLHIDGLHTLEAVRHDFETWYPKLAAGAIVLLHDIAVRLDSFGVWRFWEELSGRFPFFEFTHSCGLGLVQVGSARTNEGVLEAIFGREAAPADRIRRYYEACADAMEMRHRRTVGPYWEIVSQLFWRAEAEVFSEARSARFSLTLTTAPCSVELKVPSLANVRELRLDIANQKIAVRLIAVFLVGSGSRLIRRYSGDEFLNETSHPGLSWVPGGSQGALIIATGDEYSIVLPVPAEWESASASELTMRLEVRGVLLQTAVEAFLRDGRTTPQEVRYTAELREQEASLRQALGEAQSIAEDRGQELRHYDTALGEAQRIVGERDGQLVETAHVLAEVQGLAEERRRELLGYDAALAEAQRIVTERDRQLRETTRALAEAQDVAEQLRQEVVRYHAGLAEAQSIAEQRGEEIIRYDAALAEAQRIVTERDRQLRETTHALAEAQHLAEQLRQEVVGYDAGLAEAQSIAEQRREEVLRYHAALAEAQSIAEQRREEILRYDAGLAEAQSIAEQRREEVLRYHAALAEAQSIAEQRREEALRYHAALAEAQSIAEQRKEEVLRYHAALAEAQRLVSEREQSLRQTQLAIGAASASVAALGRQLATESASAADLRIELRRMLIVFQNCELALERAQSELVAIKRSLSWRLSRPLRAVEKLVGLSSRP